MRRITRTRDLLSPDRILSNLLRDYVEGKLDNTRILYRAVVVKIDHVGGALETDPPNPKNSIQARVITNGLNVYTQQDDLPVFWPLSTHTRLPVKEGEHVYVVFEDEPKTHGIWIDRTAEPNNVDSPNLVPGSKKYQENSANELSGVGLAAADQDTDTSDAIDITVSDEVTVEDVPPFTGRIGDYVVEGSNNTLIVMGRDRPADKASGEKDQAGTIDLVTGRADEENMNMKDDKSRIYMTMKSDIDGNFDIKVGESAGPVAGIVVKSDELRIVARNGMKIVVEGGDVVIDANTILLGKDAQEAAVLGNKLVTELGKICDAITSTPPGIGQLGQVPVPLNPAITAKLNTIKGLLEQNILSKKNKVK